MEPMSLGSPVHSPGQHPPHWPSPSPASQFQQAQSMQGMTMMGGQQQHHQHQVSGAGPGTPGGFLPGYLMGEFSQQGTGRMMSPTKMASTPQTPGAFGNAPSTPCKGFLTPNASHVRTPADKPVGPPTTGLFSTPKFGGTPKQFGASTPRGNYGTPTLTTTPRGTYGTPGGTTPRGGFGTPMPTTPQLSFGATPVHNVSSVREEIFNSTGSYYPDENAWVTVFGFPPSAAGFILSQFSQYGTILQHHIPPNGNWMHLKYQTKMQAQKALGKSNRILGGSIMIGVSPCLDPPCAATDEGSLSTLHNRSQFNATGFGTPQANNCDVSVTTLNSSLGGARLNSSIRPLTQAFKAANGENEIAGKTSTPNKNTGLVGKAMEYIFGW